MNVAAQTVKPLRWNEKNVPANSTVRTVAWERRAKCTGYTARIQQVLFAARVPGIRKRARLAAATADEFRTVTRSHRSSRIVLETQFSFQERPDARRLAPFP